MSERGVDDEPGSVTLMIHQLRSDDPRQRDAAARVVWERYFHQLLGLARRQLGTHVRPRVDEDDVLQSVYQSVCRRQARGEFELFGRDDLWKLLVTVTLRKARNAGRWHTREKRDVRREAHDECGSHSTPMLDAAPGFEPTADEAVALAEAFQQRLEMLQDDTLRVIALKKLEGFTNKEIAVGLGCAERSVERKLNLIRQYWEREDALRE